MKISQIPNQIVNIGLKKPVRALARTKMMNYVGKNYQNNNTRFIAGLGILSIVLKDGMGCYMYVKQSLNNKKIPEDKRKFVAALDLANGGLMIATQLLTFFTISNKKVQTKIFDKFLGRLFERPARKGYQALLNKTNPEVTGKAFNDMFGTFKGKTRDTLGFLTALVASTIFAKRVIVPFIATPLAEKAKSVLYKDQGEKGFSPDAKNTYDANKAPCANEATK